jgi:hypothetical protein
MTCRSTTFLSAAARLEWRVARLILRPHPAEPPGKYDWVPRESDLLIVTRNDQRLLAEIAAADVVAGGESMEMVVALVAGKRVISCVPPGGRPCSLPQPEIERLTEPMQDAPLRSASGHQ